MSKAVRPDLLAGAEVVQSINVRIDNAYYNGGRQNMSLALAMDNSIMLVGSRRNWNSTNSPGPVRVQQIDISQLTATQNTTGSGGGRRVLSAKSLKGLNQLLVKNVSCGGSPSAQLTVSSCGSFAVIAYGRNVVRFDFADEKATLLASLQTANGSALAVAVSSDGQVAYVAAGGLWRVDTSASNQRAQLLRKSQFITGVAVDPSGAFLLVSEGQKQTVQQIAIKFSSVVVERTWGHQGWYPAHIAIFPDGSSALVADQQQYGSHLSFWVLKLTGTQQPNKDKPVDKPGPFRCGGESNCGRNRLGSVTFSSDGTFVYGIWQNSSDQPSLRLLRLPEGLRRQKQEQQHQGALDTGNRIVKGTDIAYLRKLKREYRRIVPKLNTECETTEQQRALRIIAQAAGRRLKALLEERPRAAQLQEVMNEATTSISQLSAAVEAALQGYKPLADGTLAKVVAQAMKVGASRTNAVEHLLRRRLGSDMVAPWLARLENVHYDALDRVARSVSPWTCKCKPAPSFAPLHEAPQEVLREAKALAKALDELTAELGLDAAATKKDADTVREKQNLFEVEIVQQCQSAGLAQRLTEQSIKTLAQLQTSIVRLTRDNVSRLALLADQAACRLEVSSALGELAQGVSQQCLSKWRSWQDRLTVRDSVLSFDHDALERFLVTMGRCWWVEPLKVAGVNGATLVRATETALLGVLSAADPPATFADVRSLKLAVDSLQAGAGLPAWLASGGTVDDPKDGAVRAWSAIAVQKHLHSIGLESLATQCERLGITGAVLLSLSDEERDMRVPPGRGAKGLELSAAFCAAVLELKKLDSGAGASPSSSAGRVTAAVDARLSRHVVEALCAETAVAPAEFPIEYIRRCTHGFDDAHKIGRGAFGSVYVLLLPCARGRACCGCLSFWQI